MIQFDVQNEMKNEPQNDYKIDPKMILKIENNYTCAASRNTTDRIMVIRAKHTTIV